MLTTYILEERGVKFMRLNPEVFYEYVAEAAEYEIVNYRLIHPLRKTIVRIHLEHTVEKQAKKDIVRKLEENLSMHVWYSRILGIIVIWD